MYNHQSVTDQGHFSALLHGSFWFPIAVFIPFVQMKYQSRDPFEEYYGLLTVIVAVLVYMVAGAFVIINLPRQDSHYYKIPSKVCLLSGAFVTVSLVLIIIPFLGWILFVVWAFCFAWVAYDSKQDFKELLKDAKGKISDIWKKLTTTEEGSNRPSV